MRILVTNDDGVDSPGIRALAKALLPLGRVTVVAPADQQSAIGHSITIFHPLTIAKVMNGQRTLFYGVDGTPADCVKLAVGEILTQRPHLIVSGINHGGNLGINVIYSGTVAGAMEGAILGIPSIAVSLNTHVEARFEGYARLVAQWIAEHKTDLLREAVAYNVNVPCVPLGRIRGFTWTRMHALPYVDSFHRRLDPRGRTYFWLGVDPITESRATHRKRRAADQFVTDLEAIGESYVSVTPLSVDRTNYRLLSRMCNGNGTALPTPEPAPRARVRTKR